MVKEKKTALKKLTKDKNVENIKGLLDKCFLNFHV